MFDHIWHSAMMKAARGIWMSCEYTSLSVLCVILKQLIQYIATQILSWSCHQHQHLSRSRLRSALLGVSDWLDDPSEEFSVAPKSARWRTVSISMVCSWQLGMLSLWLPKSYAPMEVQVKKKCYKRNELEEAMRMKAGWTMGIQKNLKTNLNLDLWFEGFQQVHFNLLWEMWVVWSIEAVLKSGQ